MSTGTIEPRRSLLVLFLLLSFALASVSWVASAATVSGELKKWHTVTIDFDGPSADELDVSPNPFLDYRLQVQLTGPSGQVYSVPGFFDGDGNGNGNGSVWRVRFTPDEGGQWTYLASFREGADIAVSLDPLAGTATHFDQESGAFIVGGLDSEAPGFYRYGRLEWVNALYLKFRDGDYWLKLGVNVPENFLGYDGFDNTPDARHSYAVHAPDWQTGDPEWDSPDRAGTDDSHGIIGALNYLADQNLNAIYFMPMNIGADGKDTWPYADPNINRHGSTANDNLHYDISKLAQWEIVLEHAQRKSIFLHFVLSDKTRANKNELDNATLGIERKLYYRELIARFGHHNALQWNVCEEYNLDLPLHPDVIKEFAQYLVDVDPYGHPVTVHNHGNTWQAALTPFLGDDRFSVLSVQTWQLPGTISNALEYFRHESVLAGRPLPSSVDESIGLDQLSKDEYRKKALWDALLSGGGHELFERSDSHLDDYTSYEQYFSEAWYARRFVEQNLPFWRMTTDDDLVSGESTDYGGAEVFVDPGKIYAIYIPRADLPATLSMPGATGAFEQSWYNPRSGQFEGATTVFDAAPVHDLGPPPTDPSEDWVVLVRSLGNATPTASDQALTTPTETPVSFQLQYSDDGGPGPYTFTIQVPPGQGGLSAVANDGTVQYTPGAGFVGIDTFTWSVDDGLVSSANATVTIQVGEGTILLADDFARPDGATVGGGWVEVEAAGAMVGIAAGTLEFTETSDVPNRPAARHSFAPSSDGQLDWAFLFDWRRTGKEGVYSVRMQLGDGSVMSDDLTDSGVAVNLTWSKVGGQQQTLAHRASGANTALGQISGPTSIRVVADLDALSYSVEADGVVLATALPFDSSVAKLDTVRFMTSGLNHRNFSGRRFDALTISAGNIANRAPVAEDVETETLVDTSVDIELIATDLDGDPLQYVVLTPPADGQLTSDDGDEFLTYTPDPGFQGQDAFTYEADDGQVASNEATATVMVDDGNAAPTANDQGVTTPVDTPVQFTLDYFDGDGPGPYVFTIETAPVGGSLSTVQPDGSVVYTPDPGFEGADSIVWSVDDGLESSGSATVSLQVANIATLLVDDFERPDSDLLGAGWIENEVLGAQIGLTAGSLTFTETSDVVNRPATRHGFAAVTEGVVEWSFLFDWARTGREGVYSVLMQLGNGAGMSDDSTSQGVGVNLVWRKLSKKQETLAHRHGGVDTELGQISGPTTIRVIVDLDAGDYSLEVGGVLLASGLPFDEARPMLDTVRFMTTGLNHDKFSGRRFDDLLIVHSP